MKVALVHDWLNGMRGGEKVLELWCDLFPEAPIYTLFYEPDRVSAKIRSHKVISSGLQKFPLTRKHYRYYLPLYPGAIRKFDLSGFDLVISTSHCVAKGVRIPRGARHVCYCLTPMRYIWDKYEDYFGDKGVLSPGRVMMSLVRGRLQRWDVSTADSVDFFIATSRYIAERIKKYYGRKSIIINPPIDTDFFRTSSNGNEAEPRGDYYLVVSALVPYKRVDVAVDAFRGRKERLLVVGTGPEEAKLKRSSPGNVTFIGWIGDEDLRRLYRDCLALIFPAEEDFGLAPLEAMACGRPVIAFKGGGALETVIPGKTGVFFPDQNTSSLSSTLEAFRPDEYYPSDLYNHALNYSKQNFFNRMRSFFKNKVNVSC